MATWSRSGASASPTSASFVNGPQDWAVSKEVTPRSTAVPVVRLAAGRGRGGAADGNYSLARGCLWPQADAIVWLDFPWGSCCCAS